MIIGINICGANMQDRAQLDNVIDCFNKIAIKHIEHDFIFVADENFEIPVANVKNTTVIMIASRPKNTFFWKFWYDYKVEKVIRKKGIEVLVNFDPACSLKSKITQFLFISDLVVLHSSTAIEKKRFQFYKKNTGKFLQKTNRIAAVSSFLKKEIVTNYKIDEQKIDIVQGTGNKTYGPLTSEEKDNIREKYTNGKEFFLYAGEVSAEKNWINLLKAFSFFKKRQKSNMQLIIMAETIIDSDFTESFKMYKYREEVKVLLAISIVEKGKIMGSAYAFVYPSLYEVFPAKIIEAMQCEVPVIASNIDSIVEIGGDAILYANPNSFEDIADKMMLLFKDENKRNELIIKGNKQALKFNLEKTADLLWESIVKTTPT